MAQPMLKEEIPPPIREGRLAEIRASARALEKKLGRPLRANIKGEGPYGALTEEEEVELALARLSSGERIPASVFLEEFKHLARGRKPQ